MGLAGETRGDSVAESGDVVLHVTAAPQVPLLDDLVHDGIVSVSRISYHASRRALEMPMLVEHWPSLEEIGSFWLWRKVMVPWNLVTMSMAGVIESCIADDQRIDLYVIEELSYDPRRARLTLHTAEPTRIWIEVEGLDVLVRMRRARVRRLYHWLGPFVPLVGRVEWPAEADD
jgi:hypothetical protein